MVEKYASLIGGIIMIEWLRPVAVGVLAFGMSNVVLGGAGRSAAWRAIYAVIGGAVLAVHGVLWLLVNRLSMLDWSLLVGISAAAVWNGLRVQNAFGRAWALPAWGRFDWIAGAVVVAVFVFGIGGKSGKKQEIGPAVQIEQKAAPKPVLVPVQQMQPGEKAACVCYTGAELCTGPQGGRYCVSDDGKRRYR